MPFKLLGITDEITVCDCCGKTNLKCTVALEAEDGGIVHYGRDCAGKALFGSKNAKNTDIVTKRAKMIQGCRNKLPEVLKLISEGKGKKEIEKAIGLPYSVSFGFYSDTKAKMPLRIYNDGWTFPGVEIPAGGY